MSFVGAFTGRMGGRPAGTVALPLTTAEYDGDSRTYGAGRRLVGAGFVQAEAGTGGGLGNVASVGFVAALLGNRYVLREGFQHAVGGSSTEGMRTRLTSPKMDSTLNPARDLTAFPADGIWNQYSDGVFTAASAPGSLVVSASAGVNDGIGYFDISQKGWPNNLNIRTMENIGDIADAYRAGGKVWLLGNEKTRGRMSPEMEVKAAPGASWSATNTAGFIDGETFGAPGVIGRFGNDWRRMVKGVDYAVTAGGVYTVISGSNPDAVWLNYAATQASGSPTGDRLRVINEWLNSSAAVFVAYSTGSAVNYGIPGFKFGRPHVIVADTFNAGRDPSTGAAQLSRPGCMDSAGLHDTMLGQLITSKAIAAAALADPAFAAAPSLDYEPVSNNWTVALGTGANAVYTGTLPPSMRKAVYTLVTRQGAVLGRINPNGNYTAAPANTEISDLDIDFSSGDFTITIASAATWPLNHVIMFEQDIGNYNVFAFTSGTIGRNPVMNAMKDMAPAVAIPALAVTTGSVTNVNGAVTASQIPYGWVLDGQAAFNQALINGTATIGILNPTITRGGVTYTGFRLELEGWHSAAWEVRFNHGCNNAQQRLTNADKFISGTRICYDNHSVKGSWHGAIVVAQAQVLTGAVERRGFGPTSDAIYPGITALISRGVVDGGVGVYPHSGLLVEYGGPLDLYRLGQQVSLKDATSISAQFNYRFSGVANVPFALSVTLSGAQARRRNDVE